MLGNGKAEFDWPCDAWQRQGTAVQSKGYEVNCCAVALRSTAAATGAYCSAKADGKDSIAVVNGACGKACGALGCYLVLTEYDDDGNMLLAKMAKVDGAVIKENTWYTLKNGEFVEAAP